MLYLNKTKPSVNWDATLKDSGIKSQITDYAICFIPVLLIHSLRRALFLPSASSLAVKSVLKFHSQMLRDEDLTVSPRGKNLRSGCRLHYLKCNKTKYLCKKNNLYIDFFFKFASV